MLDSLKIKNFAIIEDLNISFSKGMNILLGETGAGKSIIIDALGLLMGNRSDFDKIRNGEIKALVEGSFYIDNEVLKNKINAQYDFIEDDNLLVVSRTLESGKSICRVNYHLVSQSVLKQIMEDIIDIHSQHKNNSFFNEKEQIDFLDLYINKNHDLNSLNFNKTKKEYDEVYKSYIKETKILKELINKRKELEDIDYLSYQIQEIEKVNLKENEIEEIEDELIRLNSFEKIYEQYHAFEENYSQASNYLYQAKKDLNGIKDDKFAFQIERFESSYYELDDVFDSIKSLFNELEDAKERIEYLTKRKLELAPLRRKYGRSTTEILSFLNSAKETIDLAINFENTLSNQEKTIEELSKKAIAKGKELSMLRKEGAKDLEMNMLAQFKDLALNNASFKVEFNEDNINNKGIDQIKFLLQANVGSKFLSLSQSASLGETSRINLAFKVVFNNLNPVETIIFDEIDTGISSQIGVLTAKKIKQISGLCQSIVITHLPQMAAICDHCYFVSKESNDITTKTKIKKLTKDELITEIAKMISGQECNNISYQAAKELVENMNK